MIVKKLQAPWHLFLHDVRAILDSLAADGSWGVHNFKYTESVLQEAWKKLASLGEGAA